MLLENFVSTAEAGRILGITSHRVRVLCREGRFEGAAKLAHDWIIPRIAVLSHTQLPRGPKTNSQKKSL